MFPNDEAPHTHYLTVTRMPRKRSEQRLKQFFDGWKPAGASSKVVAPVSVTAQIPARTQASKYGLTDERTASRWSPYHR